MTAELNDTIATDIARWPMLIAGRWTESANGKWRDVVSPGDGNQILAQVPDSCAEDVDRAVQAAHQALPGWSGLHFRERQRLLLRVADAIEAQESELATLTARDTGNALRTQGRPECATLTSLFRYFGGVAGEFKGSVLPAGNDQLQYTRREPLGVVGAILPWNSPLMIAGMKVPAALAAGNTIVLKPAEDAPLTILMLAAILHEHLPAGVVNVVTGPGPVVGHAIAEHPGIAKVSFTGSTTVGRHIARTAGERLAHVSLELGGKSPSIVFPSAATPEHIDATVEGVLLAMRFTRQGQSCTAGSRLFVHADVYDRFLTAVVERVSRLRVGNPLDEDTDMGAIINQQQFDSIIDYVADGRAQAGVKVLLDGTTTATAAPDGLYQGPTILADVDNAWRIAQEEIFGPVLVAIRWHDVDEVVAMANATHYGLAAYIWSHDLDEAICVAHRVDAGWVQVNQGGGQMVGQAYGGYKDSGIGREFSLEGAIDSFTQTKQINVKLGG